jgi:hypothetical protein
MAQIKISITHVSTTRTITKVLDISHDRNDNQIEKAWLLYTFNSVSLIFT